ncbi:MAG: PEGA domain-containing protein [Candidatus Omnitrophota bacterium]
MKKYLILLLGISLFLSGCIERKLFVRTDPPNADFYFNEQLKGKTPLSFDFEWYWTHEVRVEKEGYKEVEKEEVIKAPPYMWIPLDFLAELLPFKIKDYHYLDYKLEEISSAPEKEQNE